MLILYRIYKYIYIFFFQRRDYEEEYDYYRGPKKPVHERLGGAGVRMTQKRQPKRQENSYDSYEDENDQDFRASKHSSKPRNKKDFKNFKVTVRNEERDDYYESEGKLTETFKI